MASEDITEIEKKKNKLLHLGGPQLQEVAYSLPGAIRPYDKEENNDVFEILVNKLSDYFSPKQNSTFERHVFRGIHREEGENFNKFLLRIRQQAKRCSFGKSETEAVEINMKDKIIDNWAPIELKKKLLEKERSLDEIIELCQVHEQIGNQSTTMTTTTSAPSTSSAAVNKIGIQHNRRRSELCMRCGKPGHAGNIKACPAKDAKCRKCGLQGHYHAFCKTRQSLKRSSKSGTNLSAKRFRSGVNSINVEDDASEEEDNMRGFDCFKISNTKRPIEDNVSDDLIECFVGGVPLTLLIDSGSKANIIKGKYWELLVKKNAAVWDIDRNTTDKLKSYASKSLLKVKHRFVTTVNIRGQKEIIAPFYVIINGDISIIGKHTAKQLGILKLGINANKLVSPRPFPKVKGILVKLSIDPYVKPVQQPLRRVPVSVELQVEDKLNEALQSDVIEKVEEPSPWISPVVIIFKPNNDIRMCVDMRRANQAILRENYPLPTFDSFMTKLRGAKYFSRLDA